MDTLVQLLEFPSSLLLAISFLLAIYLVHRFAGNHKIVKELKSIRTARILLAIGAILLAIEGTWSLPIHKSVGFSIYVLLLLSCMALALLNGIKQKAKFGFILNHLGLFLIIWASLFGAPDVSRSKAIVAYDYPVKASYTSDGLIVPLPFEINLKEFRIDYYSDGQNIRQFTSILDIDGKQMETAVNSPCSYKGYTFYQDSYDVMDQRYTVLQMVKDPWLPVVYIGMLMLTIGSILLLFGKWKAKFVIPVALFLTILFTALTVARINFGTLMPALRSWWFVPHLFIYMVAYSLMALALIMWWVERLSNKDKWHNLSDNLMRSSSALLIIGMLCGSVWARQAWGDYWAWDPKENWAAVTWFVSLMYLHLGNKRNMKAISIIIFAFLALQVTWYGVNYLPSAMQSMHTYNK